MQLNMKQPSKVGDDCPDVWFVDNMDIIHSLGENKIQTSISTALSTLTAAPFRKSRSVDCEWCVFDE